MTLPFLSLSNALRPFLQKIIQDDVLHAKWLNTLSYLENCGARKIAAFEHPTLVKKEVLKHAAEEFRHAHHLKKEIGKLKISLPTYALSSLLGGILTKNYLNTLDLFTSRYLSFLPQDQFKQASYLLVTFAIELRAEELYLHYSEELKKQGSPVAVKSIFLEEMGHLDEMRKELHLLPNGFEYAKVLIAFEGALCKKWIGDLCITSFTC